MGLLKQLSSEKPVHQGDFARPAAHPFSRDDLCTPNKAKIGRGTKCEQVEKAFTRAV
jgi:hypothetical protein